MKKIYQLMIIMILGAVSTSCVNNNPYYDEPFLGTWEAVSFVEYDREYDLRPGEWHRYVFYSDGTGAYEQAGGLRTRFYWDEYGRERIELRHNDGLHETLYFDFDRAGYLLLSTYHDFRTYFVYHW